MLPNKKRTIATRKKSVCLRPVQEEALWLAMGNRALVFLESVEETLVQHFPPRGLKSAEYRSVETLCCLEQWNQWGQVHHAIETPVSNQQFLIVPLVQKASVEQVGRILG